MLKHVLLNTSKDNIPVASKVGTSMPVMLIGFQNQDNLGIGYLASTLASHGYFVKVLDIELRPEHILETVLSEKPVLIGFSLIFQFYLLKFRDLMKYLRYNGVDCHFTIGGHFPSLSHQKTLESVAEVDSVIRFEGEYTLLELVDCLAQGKDWRIIDGIAYRQGSEIISNPLRPLINDLDNLPYPNRPLKPKHVLGKKIMPILASRGCAQSCSFCSIHMFYRSAPGKTVRTRKPEKVVEEMKTLYEERGIVIFLFQDDNFPLFGTVWRRWVMSFIRELDKQKLTGKVIWKISCRADAVESELFSCLREAGLYLVYMGLESGSDEGLNVLHKQITAEQNLRAISILKELGIMWEFGFMLFDPSSTFDSIRTNVKFLRCITEDGSIAATFCKMLPYDGTPIKGELMKSYRFRGDVCNPDYDFLDLRLNKYYEELGKVVIDWVNGTEAVSPQLNLAWHEVAILKRLFPEVKELEDYKSFLREITKASNDLLFSAVEKMASLFENSNEPAAFMLSLDWERKNILSKLHKKRNEFIYQNQEILLKALDRDAVSVCV